MEKKDVHPLECVELNQDVEVGLFTSRIQSLKRGARFRADWDRSQRGWVQLQDLEAGRDLGAAPDYAVRKVRVGSCGQSFPGQVVEEDLDDELLFYRECLPGEKSSPSSSSPSVSSPSSSGFSLASMMAEASSSSSSSAPDLEAGLSTFAWPLSLSRFRSEVYKSRAFCVLGHGSRCAAVRDDFFAGDVSSLIAAASNVTVWMATREGQMQHLVGGGEFALACYDAGHTLYFNHPREVQARYVRSAARDLGGLWGSSRRAQGDMEVFAVNRRHVTEWHLDAQENFTMQLRGTKVWTIMPGVRSPATNCVTPTNTFQEAYRTQKKVHRFTSDAPNLPPTDFSRARTIVLRPGGVLYVPGGWWHRVECISDDGALAVNYALVLRTWAELLQSFLAQSLWRSPRLRDDALAPDASALRPRLAELRAAAAALDADEMLPPAARLEPPDAATAPIARLNVPFDFPRLIGARSPWELPESDDLQRLMALDSQNDVLRRNRLAVLVLLDEEERQWARERGLDLVDHSPHAAASPSSEDPEGEDSEGNRPLRMAVHLGFGAPPGGEFESTFEYEVRVPRGDPRYLRALELLSALTPGEEIALARLLSHSSSSSRTTSSLPNSSPPTSPPPTKKKKVSFREGHEGVQNFISVLIFVGFLVLKK